MSETIDGTTTLVDFAFKMCNAVLRYIRLEGRAANAKCGALTFHIGGPGADTPCLAVGDTYSAITKLAVGSITSPGTIDLSVTGTVSMPGYIFCSGMVNSTGIKHTSTGQVSYTSGQVGTIIYVITFATVHPIGYIYITNITGKGVVAIMQNCSPAPTSQTFQVQCYAVGTATLTNGGFNFMVLAS